MALLEKTALEAPIDAYLKVNSGMNRLGFTVDNVRVAWNALEAHPQVRSITLMTHFADAEGSGIAAQLGWFGTITEAFRAPRSLANSAALLRFREPRAGWVRPGLMLYGCSPFADWSATEIGLEPAMTLGSELIAVQNLAAGERVGYGFSFEATEPMTLGVVACGYADGYPRHAPNGTPVEVAGMMTGTVGRVSMDLLCVDLTPVPDAAVLLYAIPRPESAPTVAQLLSTQSLHAARTAADGTVVLDMSGAFDASGRPNGQPLDCDVRASASTAPFATGAQVTDCVVGEGGKDLGIPASQPRDTRTRIARGPWRIRIVRRGIQIVAAALLLVHSPASASREVLREQSETSVDVRGVQALEVNNARGRVDLVPSPDEKLHVSALKIVRYCSRERAEELARGIVVETAVRNDRYVIDVRYQKHQSIRISFWDLFKVDGMNLPAYEVRVTCQVPRGLDVHVRESSGDIRSEGIAGAQVLRTSSGDIEVVSADGPLEASSSSGDVTATSVGQARVRSTSGDIVVRQSGGPVRASTSSGRITVAGAEDSLALSSSSGDIRADRAPRGLEVESSSGDVQVQAVAGWVRVGTTSGDVRLSLREPLRGVDATSSSGRIRLALDPTVGCTLDMRTSSGTIDVDQPMQMKTISRRNVSGVIRGGKAPVVLHTSSGDITIVGGGQ